MPLLLVLVLLLLMGHKLYQSWGPREAGFWPRSSPSSATVPLVGTKVEKIKKRRNGPKTGMRHL
jgi:hypothetical protein